MDEDIRDDVMGMGVDDSFDDDLDGELPVDDDDDLVGLDEDEDDTLKEDEFE